MRKAPVIDVPDGRQGDWKVERFSVSPSEADADRLRGFIDGSGRYVPSGDYVRLMRDGHVIMSNTPDEMADHLPFVSAAKGDVLINGLGLGVVIEMIMQTKPDLIRSMTVIEIDKDVIDLVGSHYLKKYPVINIIHDDAMTWKSPVGIKYDAVWHDIWDDVTSDNLPAMKTLARRYGRKAAWQGSWARKICERLASETSIYWW